MRTFCEYCHGNTEEDQRGNCVACGAQKKTSEENKRIEDMSYMDVLDIMKIKERETNSTCLVRNISCQISSQSTDDPIAWLMEYEKLL